MGKWKNIDLDEIKAFIVLFYQFEINYLPEIEQYWSNSKLFTSNGVKEIMYTDHFR
jgi:hypothetical protein